MSGIGVAIAVVGSALFGVILLSIFGLLAIGLGWAEGVDAAPAERPSQQGIDFDRNLETRRRHRNLTV
jgi:hypothetical protein